MQVYMYAHPSPVLRHIPAAGLYERDRWRGGEGAFKHLPVMYPLISINYVVLHAGRSNDNRMHLRARPPRDVNLDCCSNDSAI